MKKSQRIIDEELFVETELGDTVICDRCGARLSSYAEVCQADLADPCPGFLTIEKAREEFNRRRTVASLRSIGPQEHQ